MFSSSCVTKYPNSVAESHPLILLTIRESQIWEESPGLLRGQSQMSTWPPTTAHSHARR